MFEAVLIPYTDCQLQFDVASPVFIWCIALVICGWWREK